MTLKYVSGRRHVGQRGGAREVDQVRSRLERKRSKFWNELGTGNCSRLVRMVSAPSCHGKDPSPGDSLSGMNPVFRTNLILR